MSKTKYDKLKSAYDKTIDAINKQTKTQEKEKKQREKQAKTQLENTNRSVYNSYLNAINPYGRDLDELDPAPDGVSEYFKNAAYGEYLKGLGQAQSNYDSEIAQSNSLWQDYLSEKAGLKAQAEKDYADAYADMKNEDAELLLKRQKFEAEQREKEEKKIEQANKAAQKSSSKSSSSGTKNNYSYEEQTAYYTYKDPVTGRGGYVKGKQAADALKAKGYITRKASSSAVEMLG